MKTREELARNYAFGRCTRTTGFPTKPQGAYFKATEANYLAGFDAGFARAIEMLTTQREWPHSFQETSEWWGDWLEQQVPDEHESEDKK